jgi:nephrocystin-3
MGSEESSHSIVKDTEIKFSMSASVDANRAIRVFVSSTFRDMMEERNALMTHTWPELRRFCKERQVELVEVDLRWGISEEQSKRQETVKICLDEIRACRPFFIGLLGERYGWVPEKAAFSADLNEEQPWLANHRGKSATELEILHGVLNNPDMAGRAFFYFRDPAYVKTRGTDSHAESPEAVQKQTQLKDSIRAVCATKKIPLHENYSDPINLAALVLDQLKTAIDGMFPKENIPDLLARDARDHEAFAEIRRRTYIGRPEYFAALDSHVASEGSPLLLVGDSGSGKSALIANWVEHWRRKHPKDFIFQHYIGGTSDGAVHWKLMTRLMAEIKRWNDDSSDLPRINDEILRDFPFWLAKGRIKAEHDGVKFIVILDALNQLEDKDHAHALGWLPNESFFGSFRLIVSAMPGGISELLEKRSLMVLRVEHLTTWERERMIIEYLERFGKKLDEQRVSLLSSAPAATNPLYLKIVLDELRVTGTHDELDNRLNEYLKAKGISTLLHDVLIRYQRDYERDRKGMVSDALGLIWSSRQGLTETELLQLLRPKNLPQLPMATWSPLRAVLEESLIDRGGILNFAHDFLRKAVETAFA